MLVETLKAGRVVIEEVNDRNRGSGADEVIGFHIETAESREEWDREWMAPESEAAILREIRRAGDLGTPALEVPREPRGAAMRKRLGYD